MEQPLDASVEALPCAGFALSLDGTNSASIARRVQNDFTLEAWIQTASSLTGTNYFQGRSVIDADVVGGAADDFATTILNDRFVFGVGNPDTTLPALSIVTTNQWVHVAATRRQVTGELQVFVNGSLEAADFSSNTSELAASLRITFGRPAIVRNFIGLIDEVRIWNVVRTPPQIQAAMRSRLLGSEDGLVGYFSFEDQGETTTADSSDTGVAAILTGAPAYAASTALCSTAL